VSIILPTYNRAGFLEEALASIQAQRLADWELIVVDDGSTDDSPAVIRDLVARWRSTGMSQPVRFVTQANQGAYAARNAGIELATGEYLAFFDSDDLWLPHHLADCVQALETNPEVDLVFAPCQVVDLATGRTLEPNSFYPGGRAREFLRLRTRRAGTLQLIDDPGLKRCAITHGLAIGPQNSVCRRGLHANLSFPPFRYIEDQILVIAAVHRGCRVAYLDRIHVVYRVHQENSCCTAANSSLDKRLEVYSSLARGFEWLRTELTLNAAEARVLGRRLSAIYFWNLGYPLLQQGHKKEALEMFRRGLRLRPTNVFFWKTYLLALLRPPATTSQGQRAESAAPAAALAGAAETGAERPA
jgi:glycosyltransferase involved in cell wall biosynthesis